MRLEEAGQRLAREASLPVSAVQSRAGLGGGEGAPWYILSAKYGLVHPDTEIAPYDETLNRMGVAQRREWAARVETQMDEMLPDADEVVIFAGKKYREFLENYLRLRFNSVTVPMEGLRIGQQLSWLKRGQD